MKLSEQLKRCLDGSGCGNCEHHEADTKFTCRGLLEKAYERIKGYEELEEQGLLLKLPCKVGNIVYEILQFAGDEKPEIDVHKIKLDDLDNIGKTVFLTESDAENALQKMNEMEGEE